MYIIKFLTTLILVNVFYSVYSQTQLPYCLKGSWQIENSPNIEHWDSISEGKYKGFQYKIKDGVISVNEYLSLDINKKENNATYNAIVLNQNKGKKITFNATLMNDYKMVFENQNHDFPKIIIYELQETNKIKITISDGKQKSFSYTMTQYSSPVNLSDSTIKNPNYDPNLALKTGADNYGMKPYYWVILKTGNNDTLDQTIISNAFRQHLDNINKLVANNKLIVVGPLTKNEKKYRGIFIFNVTTKDEVINILQTDETIKLGILQYEIYQWYGSAALPEYLEAADKVWKVKP